MTDATLSLTAARANQGTNRLILGIVLAVVTFWLFAQTTLNVAPTMRDDLHITNSESNIAVSITALFSGIFIVVAGGLADQFGRVKLTYIGLALSILGSLLIALSPPGTAMFLMAGRIIQGISAACIMPATLALMKAYFSDKERQRALSFWSIGSWGGSGVCALFGGLVASTMGWRWIFWMSIAVAIASFLLIRGTPESKVETVERKPFDWFGLITFIVAMVALNVVIGQGSALGWSSSTVLLLTALFVVSAVAFLKIESSSPFGFWPSAIPQHNVYRRNIVELPAQRRSWQFAGDIDLGSAGGWLVFAAIGFVDCWVPDRHPVHNPGRRKTLAENGAAKADADRLLDHGCWDFADELDVSAGARISHRRLYRIHAVRGRTGTYATPSTDAALSTYRRTRRDQPPASTRWPHRSAPPSGSRFLRRSSPV